MVVKEKSSNLIRGTYKAKEENIKKLKIYLKKIEK